MANLSLIDLEELAEGYDVEVKKAAGHDGQGECPKSFFESYVAMANTQGGVIFLGLMSYLKENLMLLALLTHPTY
ncbi:helix-turn-helix domain-containing protein [Gloeocapsopsis dulcis]|uniref:AlbA family DNA-binding domain-containing protein n=1 Tax=Gloeocapsopsis dulcis TaxID=2859516 RepID=UPI0018C832BF|nr:hypothetical protein [Gloeocapsopsis dulcis]WNN91436.1 hypothetical protein P0S91_10340 [Gloeocapsopsis dulcis]